MKKAPKNRPDTNESGRGVSKTVSIAPDSRPNTRDRITTAEANGTLPDIDPQTTAEMWEEMKGNCINYIFPPHIKVSSKAIVRMSLYAKYGPAVEDIDGRLKLRGSKRPLQHHEELLMMQEEERALVFEVYGSKCNAATSKRQTMSAASVSAVKSLIGPNTNATSLDDTSYGEINTKKHQLLWTMLEMTKPELHEILESTEYPQKEKDGKKTKRTTLADTISNALLVERERRVRVLKGTDPTLDKLRTDTDVTKKNSTRFYNKTFPKAYEVRTFEDPRDVQRALHRSAFQIAEYGDRNKPDVNYNIRCLRPEFRLRPGEVKEGWDNFSCTRKSHSGKASTLRK